MYQRLLLILSVLFVSGAAMAQNIMTPTDPCYKYISGAPTGTSNPSIPSPTNQIVKWVHDPSQNGAGRDNSGSNADTIGSHGFDQSTYKCYRYGNTSFRIRFPNNYNPANPDKYPLVLFFHGAGEAAHVSFAANNGANRENQDQLYWGAQLFEQRMNQGQWNGFLLFPQVMDNSSQWDFNNPAFSDMANVLDTLQKYHGFDPDRLITMGLSAGGVGCVNFANTYPKRVASVVSANPRFIEGLIAPNIISNFLQIPIWVAFGGLDDFPGPEQVMQFRDSVSKYGGNIYATYHGSQGHSSWSLQWAQPDVDAKLILSKYWNTASKAQPLLYYQQSSFCAGSPISAPMALTQGFAAYEWQYNGGGGYTTVGTNSYTYTATQPGSYRVHFKRTASSDWSAWTPNPVVISTKSCVVGDTAFAEHFENTPIANYITFAASGGGNSPYYKGNYDCQNGVFVNGTESFTQDATGKLGGRFMVNNTYACTNTYRAGDQIWRTYNNATVTPNTDYVFSFYMGNQGMNNGAAATTPVTTIAAKINGVSLSPTNAQTVLVGDYSWKKYTFNWNSGNTNSAELAITNNSASTTGNDFVLDEISLVKFKFTAPMPGYAYQNVALWAKANNINDSDNSPVGIWTNSDVNGNNLTQSVNGALPTLKNNATSNINFNPIVNFDANSGQLMQVGNGFSGTATHTAVTAYVVSRFANNSQDSKNIFVEAQNKTGTGGSAITRFVRATLNSNGVMSWTAGLDPLFNGGFTNTVSTPQGTIEANKPTVWTFSKDNNNTASGFKQDIRKNGVVVASNNTNTTTFTGVNGAFGLTNGGQFFSGDIAEVIYILDSTITAARQNNIESYLAIKYGTTMGTPAAPINYTASDSTTVFWPGLLNASFAKFQNDVFGIGIDSLSGLVQTKSNSVNTGSGDGTGQSGLGNLVLSTNATLMNKKFLMIGNSHASLTQQTIASGNPILLGSSRVGRNWKINNIGVGPVDLSFDTTGLGPQAGGTTVNKYSLLISASGDTTYTGSVAFFTATGASGKKIIFSGVTLPDDAVFTIITNNLNVTLPAVWLGFTAEAVTGNGLLKWKTSDEINVAAYTVEHSFNGVSFTTVGSVTANNNTGVNQYSFVHTDLAAGIHYYRIRRTDKDGKFEYSDIKSIKITATGANVQVRPNPVVGSTLVLAVSTQQSTKTNIQVAGVDGKVIVQQNVNLATGNNMVNINISTVPPGIYLVRVQLADEVITKKFIKER